MATLALQVGADAGDVGQDLGPLVALDLALAGADPADGGELVDALAVHHGNCRGPGRLPQLDGPARATWH